MPISGDIVEKEPVVVEPSTGEKPVIKVEPPQQEYEEKRTIVRSREWIWWVLLVIEVILIIRFFIKLFGADPDNLFSILVDLISFPFVFIFIGLFSPSVSQTSNVVVEWSTLFAIFVYLVVAIIISRFFKLKKPIGPEEADEKA